MDDERSNPRTVEELEELGRSTRRFVLGDHHVDRAPRTDSPILNSYRRFADRNVWGGGWSRPGLDIRIRAICTVAVVATLGADEQTRTHIRGALRSGVTADELAEILVQVAVYAGAARGAQAFRIAGDVLDERGRT